MIQRWQRLWNTPIKDLTPIERVDGALLTLLVFASSAAACWAVWVVFLSTH